MSDVSGDPSGSCPPLERMVAEENQDTKRNSGSVNYSSHSRFSLLLSAPGFAIFRFPHLSSLYPFLPVANPTITRIALSAHASTLDGTVVAPIRFAVMPIDGFTRFCYIYPDFRFRVTSMENVLTLNQKSPIVISTNPQGLGLKPGAARHSRRG